MSVSINVNVSGAEEFKAAMSRFDSAMQNRIQQQLTSWAQNVKTYADRLVPVRTGHLQRSIFVKVQNWQVQVGAEASYAAAVEFGTLYVPARPYLVPAVKAHTSSLERIFKDAIEASKAEAKV
ncbi:MAG: HK97 gp10 family phage protein [Candidatus Bathyarchaeota archaeon]|nr:HK97 gp10 family phage protein [Candidatus Bathyarchaeota archaeon]